jgi:hypothetical protein
MLASWLWPKTETEKTGNPFHKWLLGIKQCYWYPFKKI